MLWMNARAGGGISTDNPTTMFTSHSQAGGQSPVSRHTSDGGSQDATTDGGWQSERDTRPFNTIHHLLDEC